MSENIEHKQEKKSDEMFCPSCAGIIKKEAEICPKCGVRVKSPPTEIMFSPLSTDITKLPGIAMILSFCFPGLGQLYNRQYAKGLSFIVAGVIIWNWLSPLSEVGFGTIIFIPFWLFNIYDAKMASKK
jgi:TM2 domain-containing membrane protein YozV